MRNMSTKILTNITESLAEKRSRAEIEAEKRKDELFAAISGLAEAEQRFKISGIEYAKLLTFGKVSKAIEKKQDMDNASALITKLLSDNGYPGSVLEPHYNCLICKDTGYIHTNSGTAADLEPDSGTAKIGLCSCVRQKYYKELAGCADALFADDAKFSAFDESLYSDNVNPGKYDIPISPRSNINKIRSRCEQFISNFNDPKEKDLLFCGSTGTGKTFMANCIGREIISRGYTVFRQSAPRMFELINRSRFEGGSAYEDVLKSDLLILDDLGVETQSASKFSTLYDILETRHSQAGRKPLKTIISTNLNMKDLFNFYDERIVSRLMYWYDALRFAGDDIRFILSAKHRQ